jgi:very-short-patch-repair endonuclease
VRHLPPEEVTVADGIPVTTWARTALDVAETQPVDGLLEQAEILRIFDLHEVRAVMARNPGRRGLRRLATALERLEDAPAIPKTVLERRFLAFCRRLGLPEPEQQVLIGEHRVDFLWREAGLVVEADSRTFHEIRAAFERDRRRDLELAALGLQVLRVTSRQLDRPPAALAGVLTARARSASR